MDWARRKNERRNVDKQHQNGNLGQEKENPLTSWYDDIRKIGKNWIVNADDREEWRRRISTC